MRKYKKFFSMLLAVIMMLSMITTVQAAGTNFPLKAANGDLVADDNTRFVTVFNQDPVSKMITAEIQVHNNSAVGSAPVSITGLGMQISFDNRIAPFEYDPASSVPPEYALSKLFINGSTTDSDTFEKYTYAPINTFELIGATLVRNSTEGGIISCQISTTQPKDTLYINPGEALTVLKVFFMPKNNGTDILDLNMFHYEYLILDGLFKYCTWLGNGAYFMVAQASFPTSTDTYVLSPSSFKIHTGQMKPVGLQVNDDTREVVGYNASTMEWAYAETGPYTGGVPTINDELQTIYVRMAATDYVGSGDEYGNYKKYLPSEAVELSFDAVFYSAKDDVSLVKTSENKASTDGKTHVGDTIEYTVTASNGGNVKSVWADAVMTDTLSERVDFVQNSVTVNGNAAGNAADYDETARTLTVTLGDIPGQTDKVVIFRVTVSEKAYGKNITNSVMVVGKDGGDDGEEIKKETDETGGGHDIVAQSDSPAINPIVEGDDKITGEGTPGAEIVVKFPDGSTETVTVDGDGNWEVDAPSNLKNDDEVEAVQTEPGKDASEPAVETVGQRPTAAISIEKTSKDETSTDGKIRVNDTLEYTITVSSNGDSRSVAKNTVVTDTLPAGVTFVDGSVMIGGNAAGSSAVYAGGTLTVTLGDMPGGTTKVINFKVTVNSDAYGADITNSASVSAKDGGSGEDITGTDEDDEKDNIVTGKSEKPYINEISAGDKTVDGTGVPGSTIEVTFPGGGLMVTTTVDDDGNWQVSVPESVNLVVGNTVKAVQTEDEMDPSDPVLGTVQQKPVVIPSMTKTSENATSTDGKTHVNDNLEYTIEVSNLGSPKSTWMQAVLTDVLPLGITIDRDSVLLDGQVPTYSYYNASTRTLLVTLGNIVGGTTKVVTFDAKVNADAYGMNITNSASVAGKEDGSGNNIVDETEEEGGGRDVLDKSEQPTVDEVTKGDETISGEGVPGAEIVVTLPDGTELETTVDEDGKWSVDVPDGKEPGKGDEIIVIQTEKDKDPSDPVKEIVGDKSHREVTGYVWPMLTDAPEVLGSEFLKKHDIVVELRSTFATEASSELSTITTLIDAEIGLGQFTIENVPFGTYVLYIKRPGYLTRCMMVTVSQSDPDVIELTPPDGDEFVLWYGDCNNDGMVGNLDVMRIIEQMSIGATALDSTYDSACDLDGDGAGNNKDIMRVIENWNKTIFNYPGASGVDFSI